MKVLAIAPQPFFTPRGTPLSVYYRTLVTAEMGHEVDLLTYGQGVDADIPGVRIVRIPAFRWLGSVKVGPSLLKAFLDIFIVLWALGMMIRRRYDIVHAHEEAVFFSRFLKPVFRFRLIYDLHSILSQQLTNFGFTRSKLLIGTFRRLEDGCITKADAVITISPALAEYAEPRVRDPEVHFLIENSLFDPLRLKQNSDTPIDDHQWLYLLNGPRPVVLYAGTFESYQGIGLLLEGFAMAREAGVGRDSAPGTRDSARENTDPGLESGSGDSEPFLLVLGGRPEQVREYQVAAEALGITDHCRFTGQVSRELAQRATREASVLTSPRTVGDNTPLKIYEQIASGVPLVATRISSHTQVLSDDNCILVEAAPAAIGEGIVAALQGGEAVQRRVANARALYDERYSPQAYRDKMQRLFDAVTA